MKLTNMITRVGKLIRRNPKSAQFAKERLQIIISHERDNPRQTRLFCSYAAGFTGCDCEVCCYQ